MQQPGFISTSAFQLVYSRALAEEKRRISVVIPVLQEEKLIEKTLAVFTPELRADFAIEVIISDGGSTDGTLDIARRHADKIVCHTGAHRQTIAEGRNCGAAVAEGDILIFMNGDTYPARPDDFFSAVRTWSLTARERNEAALACPVHIPPEERIFFDRVFHLFYNTYVQSLNMCGIGMGRGECQVVWADHFRSAGGYNARIAAGEDFDLFRRLTQFGSIRSFREMLVYESPRRFRRYGYSRVLWTWTVNALSVMIRRKAVSDEWEAVR